ncbi:hypothetical protein [Persephonella sp.]|uniref:hypothetical protein n=1 Tax=Persephonella sp. TaxID=2060922 RepID=UPI0025EDAE7B|nr:hypothetical protein [Persephonella sp.]
MKKFLMFFIFLLTFTSSFSGEVEEACKAYVSILDTCDVENYDCEALGQALENSLLKRDVDPKTAKHFHQQCVKICNLPEGKYPNIRDGIKKACIDSLKE